MTEKSRRIRFNKNRVCCLCFDKPDLPFKNSLKMTRFDIPSLAKKNKTSIKKIFKALITQIEPPGDEPAKFDVGIISGISVFMQDMFAHWENKFSEEGSDGKADVWATYRQYGRDFDKIILSTIRSMGTKMIWIIDTHTTYEEDRKMEKALMVGKKATVQLEVFFNQVLFARRNQSASMRDPLKWYFETVPENNNSTTKMPVGMFDLNTEVRVPNDMTYILGRFADYFEADDFLSVIRNPQIAMPQKILIVGETGAGKSTSYQYLIKSNLEKDMYDSKVDGVEEGIPKFDSEGSSLV